MTSALARRLEAFGALQAEDVAVLNELSSSGRQYAAGETIIEEGERPDDVHLVVKGVACRQKKMEKGRRSIVAYLLPGEFCDLHGFILETMDHNITALSDCSVVDIPQARIELLLEKPSLSRALLMTTLVDEATLRDWVANVGQRSAHDRLAHFFCEMYLRMKVIGAVVNNSFELPINQAQLAATVGLSLVHVNKSLKALREEGAVSFRGGILVILDITVLEKVTGYKSNYLHLNKTAGRSLASSLEDYPSENTEG